MRKGFKRIITGVVTYLLASGILALIIWGASKGRQAREICSTPQDGAILHTFCSFVSPSASEGDDWLPPSLTANPPPAPLVNKKGEELSPTTSSSEVPDYVNDEPATKPPVSLQDLLSQSAAKNYFRQRRNPSQKVLKRPKGYLVCPQGGDRYFHCASILMSRSFYSNLQCANSESLKETLACCHDELSFLTSRCKNVKEDPTLMQEFMNSNKLWESYFLSSDFRNDLQDEFLKTLRQTNTISFSLFLTEISKDKVEGSPTEHRRFLSDGSLFCYTYDETNQKGRAKVAACPQSFQGQVLNLSDLKYYQKVGRSTLVLALPSWKEYCSSNQC